MKALVYKGPGQKAWDEVPDPKIEQPTDVIVKMAATTICGTDLHILKGDVPEVEPGRILGHEGIGVITEVGEGVTQLAVGDRVILAVRQFVWTVLLLPQRDLQPLPRPGRCGGDRVDLRLHDRRDAGRVRPGPVRRELGLQGPRRNDRCRGHPALRHPADRIRDRRAVRARQPRRCRGGDRVRTGRALRRHDGPPLRPVQDHRHRSGRRPTGAGHDFGATDTVNSGDPDWKDQVLALTDGLGVDVAIEAVGVPETFTMATVIVRPGGHVANIGVHGKSVDLALNELWIKNIDISMGLVNTNTLGMLLKLVAEHKLPAREIRHARILVRPGAGGLRGLRACGRARDAQGPHPLEGRGAERSVAARRHHRGDQDARPKRRAATSWVPNRREYPLRCWKPTTTSPSCRWNGTATCQ